MIMWNIFKRKKKSADLQKASPSIDVLGWSGPHNVHYTFKIKQSQFVGGYLNVWVEYHNVGRDFIDEHTRGVISGLELVGIRNDEGGAPGTSFIYEVAPSNANSIKNVEIAKGESVLGLQDCDFNCRMKVYFRPRLDTNEGMLLLHEHEI